MGQVRETAVGFCRIISPPTGELPNKQNSKHRKRKDAGNLKAQAHQQKAERAGAEGDQPHRNDYDSCAQEAHAATIVPDTAARIAAASSAHNEPTASAEELPRSEYWGYVALLPADIVGSEGRRVDDIAVLGPKRYDLHRLVQPDEHRTNDRCAAELLQHLG